MQMSLLFGNVISSKVGMDQATRLSKYFGIMSFDNLASSQTTTQAGQAFQIGTTRLKVQLKWPKDLGHPY